ALNARDALLACEPPVRPALVFRLRHVVLAAEKYGFPHRVPPGDWLLIEVADRGCGMNPEVLNQALDPFFTTKEVGQGTGLAPSLRAKEVGEGPGRGLPMVFGIVQGHQGVLTIETAPGAGTTVGLYLPRMTQAAGPPAPAVMSEMEVMEPESTQRRNILVID